MKLATGRLSVGTRPGGLMASPTFAWTARFVAEQLGVAEDLIEEIASMAMEPEDVFNRIFQAVSNDTDMEWIAIDATVIRAQA